MREDLRLKLRADSTYVSTVDGVWLRNNRGAYFVKGKSAYALIRSLFCLLDGSRTVAAICRGLTDDKRQAIENQLTTLLERGFAKEVAEPRLEAPLWAQHLYGDHLDFLDEFAADPFERFLRFRSRRIACAGSGLLWRAMLIALIEHGAGTIHAFGFGDGAEHDDIDQLVRAARERDPQMQISMASTDADPAHTPGGEYDAIVVAAAPHQPDELARFFDDAIARKSMFGVMEPIGGLLVGSPLMTADSQICWECVRRSMFIADTSSAQAGPAPASAALACQHLAHALFCHYAGVSQPADMAVSVDCQVLTVRKHRITRHPECAQHPSVGVRLWDLDAGARARPDLPRATDDTRSSNAQDTIATRTQNLIDSRVGPLLSVGEGDLQQIPLSGSTCTARAVSSTPEHPANHVLICRGLSARETRNQVVLLAFERLAREAAGTCRATLALRAETGSSDEPPLWAIGAGWTPGEAYYRSLCRASLDWAADWMAPIPDSGALLSRIGADSSACYLLRTLESLSATPRGVAICHAPTGLLVACATTPSGEFGLGAGASEEEASANALAELASKRIHPESGDSAGVQPAHMISGAPTWRELLAHAETQRRAGRRVVTCWDASELLPFCAGLAWIALVRVG